MNKRTNRGCNRSIGPVLVIMLSTSALLACSRPASAPIAPRAEAAIPADGTLPGTGERTYHIVPEQSTASYQAQEKWLRWPAPTKAVAKTGDVEGELTLIMGDQPELMANRFRVDMRTLVSEIADTPLAGPGGVFLAQRDQAVRNLLETGTYPFAEFVATGLERLPARYAEGQAVKVGVAGDLTVHGVARRVLLETEATLQGQTLSGTAIAPIRMTDYGVRPPANNGAMDVEDDLIIIVRFVANATPIAGPQLSLGDRHPKLDTPLATLARIARDRGTDEALKTASEMNLEVADGRVRIVVARGPGQAAPTRALVEDAGGEIYDEAVSVIGAWVPISAIEELADQPVVNAIRVPLRDQ